MFNRKPHTTPVPKIINANADIDIALQLIRRAKEYLQEARVSSAAINNSEALVGINGASNLLSESIMRLNASKKHLE